MLRKPTRLRSPLSGLPVKRASLVSCRITVLPLILETCPAPIPLQFSKHHKTVCCRWWHSFETSFHRSVCKLSSSGSPLGFSAAGFRGFFCVLLVAVHPCCFSFVQSRDFVLRLRNVASLLCVMLLVVFPCSILQAVRRKWHVYFSSYFHREKTAVAFLSFLFPHLSNPGCISSIVLPNCWYVSWRCI